MWISRQLSKNEDEMVSQTGKSTLNNNGNVEVVGSGVSRGVELYSPYGYSYSLPAGENVLLTKTNGTLSGVGVGMSGSDLKNGEIRISALSGAYIHFTQNGDVIINGLKINRNGVIE